MVILDLDLDYRVVADDWTKELATELIEVIRLSDLYCYNLYVNVKIYQPLFIILYYLAPDFLQLDQYPL